MRYPVIIGLALLLGGFGCGYGTGSGEGEAVIESVDPAERVFVTADSDEAAIEIAQAVVEKMGGWDNYDSTRILSWKFFGGRRHYWDRWTGDIRIEGKFGRGEDAPDYVFLMNVNTQDGRVWKNGEEIVDEAALDEELGRGHQAWVNDSYWMVMPYKLLDPGVTLTYVGERAMADGRQADVLGLTFADGTGYTPQNRYEICVAKDTGLVEEWTFYRNAEDTEAGFTMPWAGWQQFGDIMLATGRGRDQDWDIATYAELPAEVFQSPDPVQIQ